MWFLGFVLVLFLYFGWSFWFYSSPKVFTGRRVSHLKVVQMDAEEAALRREVEENQRELDAMGGHETASDDATGVSRAPGER